jgi:HEPN domain-containing protein
LKSVRYKLTAERAQETLRLSEEALRQEMYDMAAFLAEQAAQLFIKHKILELTGEMPRTHTIRQLIAVLAECTGGRWREELTEFAKRKRSLLIRLEEAYISSQYPFRRYDRDEAEELVGFARERHGGTFVRLWPLGESDEGKR